MQIDRRRLESVTAPLVVAALVGGLMWEARGLRGEAGYFPMMVAAMTILLALLEAAARFTAAVPYGVPHSAAPGVRRRAAAVTIWIAFSLTAVWLIGIIAAAGLAATIYLRVFLAAAWRRALLFGVSHAAFFWLVFQQLAGFRMHRGVLNPLGE